MNDTMSNMTDDAKLTAKLGRVLRKGEYKIKLFELRLNCSAKEVSARRVGNRGECTESW